MVPRNDQEEQSNIMTKTILAGEQVKKLTGKDPLAFL
jgi:hypothetical protein